MPYFERKPVAGLADYLRTSRPIPGMPSRGPAPAAALSAEQAAALATSTGIVEQALAVLASDGARLGQGPAAASQGAAAKPESNVETRQVQDQTQQLIDQVAGLIAAGVAAKNMASPYWPAVRQDQSFAGPGSQPITVLTAPGAAVPGETAQIQIPLLNDDTQPARIELFTTDLIGPEHGRIPAERISFDPPSLLLRAGERGQVIVRIAIPRETRDGVYSGLMRASQLAYLHAVLVVQVETS